MPNDPKDDPKTAPPSDTSLIAGLFERLVSLQENQPQPQIPITKAKICTPWNKEGKLPHERPILKRRSHLNNHPLSEMMLTEEEINLVNQLPHGKYQENKWTVVIVDGEGEGELFVNFPNKTVAQRMDVQAKAPTLVAICHLILDEAKARSAKKAA